MAVVTLLNRTSVGLDAVTKRYTSPVFTLDPLASDLEVRLRRPTTVSPLSWTNAAKVRVSIVYEVDGRPYRSTSTFTGGVRIARGGSEAPECIKRSGIIVQARTDGTKQPFVAVDPKDGRSKNWLELTRMGERALSTFQGYVEIELLSGLSASLDLLGITMITEPAPTIQYHQSVAFDSKIDAQDTSGDGTIDVTIDPVGTTDLAAFAGSGNSDAGAGRNSAATWDTAGTPIAMTEAWDEIFSTDFGHAGYYLAGIPTGSVTVNNTLSGATAEHGFGVIVMTGVNQTNPVGVASFGNTTGTTQTRTVAASANGLTVDSLYTNNTTPAAGANQDVQNTEDIGGATGFRMTSKLGSNGGTMAWTALGNPNGHGVLSFWPTGETPMRVSFIQGGGGTIGTAASTWSLVAPTTKVGGGAFIVGLGPASSVVTISTVTDNTTNVYRKAIARASTAIASAELWYCNGISSASTRISVTLSGNASGSMGIAHFTGLSTGDPHDSTASTGNFATGLSTVHTAGQVTPGSSNALVVMFSRSINSTISPAAFDGGMTAWISTNNAVRTHGSFIFLPVASTVSGQWRTNAAGTSGGTIHAAAMATFLDSRVVGGGGGPTLIPEYHFLLLGLN